MPAMGFIEQWASAFWSTLRETGPFLVLGLLFAGVLHVLVPSRIILWALGQKGWRGALRGALVGMPLPLCSCGVLPTALTLRRQGASLSASMAFAIATPETSVDAMAITAALLPAVFFGVRPLAALALAITVGVVVEFFSTGVREELNANVKKFSCGNSECGVEVGVSADANAGVKDKEAAEICRVCGLMLDTPDDHSHSWLRRGRAIFQYAFGTFFNDVATWLVVGLALAALIQILVPSGGLESSWIGQHAAVQVFLAILAGIPLYSCATATTPLAAVLLAKGVNPGAALALLLAGPASNIGNVFALKRELGARVTAMYYGSLFFFCWVLGVAFSVTWPWIQEHPSLTHVMGGAGGAAEWIAHLPAPVELTSAWIVIVLTASLWVRSLVRRLRGGIHEHHHHDHNDHGHN